MQQSTEAVDEAATADTLTGFDEQHCIIYLRLLNAQRDQANRKDVARQLPVRGHRN